jgi:hypothetical protein
MPSLAAHAPPPILLDRVRAIHWGLAPLVAAMAAPIARDLLTAVQRKFILKMSSAPDRAADPRQVGGIGSR